MKNIIVINGKKFVNDYIDFDNKYYHGKEYGYYNYPTNKCFVHIWQKSNDMREFWDNLSTIFEIWQGDDPKYDARKPLITRGFGQRAGGLQKRGVNLRSYPKDGFSIEKAQEIKDLKELAALSLG